jgi:hypothetical protein
MIRDIPTLLAEGDKRTVSHVDEVVRRVLEEPHNLRVLIDCTSPGHEGMAMRAADALQKVHVIQPELLLPYADELVRICLSNPQQEVQWHLAQILPTLQLSSDDIRSLTALLKDNFYGSKSSIVKTFSLQAMADIAERHRRFSTDRDEMIAFALSKGTPAMRSRAKKLIARL